MIRNSFCPNIRAPPCQQDPSKDSPHFVHPWVINSWITCIHWTLCVWMWNTWTWNVRERQTQQPASLNPDTCHTHCAPPGEGSHKIPPSPRVRTPLRSPSSSGLSLSTLSLTTLFLFSSCLSLREDVSFIYSSQGRSPFHSIPLPLSTCDRHQLGFQFA